MNLGEMYLLKKLAEEQKKTNDRVDAEWAGTERETDEIKFKKERARKEEIERKKKEVAKEKNRYEQSGLSYFRSQGLPKFIDKLFTGITEEDRLRVSEHLNSKEKEIAQSLKQLNNPDKAVDIPHPNEKVYEEIMLAKNEKLHEYVNGKIQEYENLMAKKFESDLNNLGLVSLSEIIEKGRGLQEVLVNKAYQNKEKEKENETVQGLISRQKELVDILKNDNDELERANITNKRRIFLKSVDGEIQEELRAIDSELKELKNKKND